MSCEIRRKLRNDIEHCCSVTNHNIVAAWDSDVTDEKELQCARGRGSWRLLKQEGFRDAEEKSKLPPPHPTP